MSSIYFDTSAYMDYFYYHQYLSRTQSAIDAIMNGVFKLAISDLVWEEWEDAVYPKRKDEIAKLTWRELITFVLAAPSGFQS
jgi:predicted nucleic acid-binding protein